MKKVAMLIFSCWIFGSCTTYKADNLPTKQLIFGNGGGYTGAVKEYILLENGQLFTRTSFDSTPTELPKIGKSTAKAIFKSYKKDSLDQLEIDNPGNLYYFINMQIDTSKSHRMTWGGGEEPPAEAKALFEKLTTLVKDNN